MNVSKEDAVHRVLVERYFYNIGHQLQVFEHYYKDMNSEISMKIDTKKF